MMVSHYDATQRRVIHRAVNACLAPLCSVDWCAVTTVEGIGSVSKGLHPVQGMCSLRPLLLAKLLVGSLSRALQVEVATCHGFSLPNTHQVLVPHPWKRARSHIAENWDLGGGAHAIGSRFMGTGSGPVAGPQLWPRPCSVWLVFENFSPVHADPDCHPQPHTLHNLQLERSERIARLHGSQCGFCTPGIVMALYTFLRNHPAPTAADLEECMDGNLCR